MRVHGKTVRKLCLAVAAAAVLGWLGWPVLRSPERLRLIFQSWVALGLLGFLPGLYDRYERTVTYRRGKAVSVSPWGWAGLESRREPLFGTGPLLVRLGWTAGVLALVAIVFTIVTSAGLGGWCRLASAEHIGTLDRQPDRGKTWFRAEDRRWSLSAGDAKVADALNAGPRAPAGTRLRLRGCTWGVNLVVLDARLDP